MSATPLPTARLPLTPSPDGMAFFVTVEVDSTPRKLLLDTSSFSGVSLACTSLAPSGTNASACLAKATSYASCPPNSTFTSLWGMSICKATTTLPVELTLGDLTASRVPASVFTSDMSLILHGADGLLGLAAQSTYTTRKVNLTDQIQSFSLNLGSKQPSIVLNDLDSEITKDSAWTAVRQKATFLNESALAVRGFSESVDETFVTTRFTQPSNAGTSAVDGWLDVLSPSIVFPERQFNKFHSKYLTACVPHNESFAYEIPHYYYCDRSVALPRLAFTTTNGTFFLDRADYVRADPNDSARTLVLVQNFSSSKYSSIAWGLGQPFLRKFPAFLDGAGKEHQITLFCKSGASCDLRKWVVNGTNDYDYDYDSDYDSGSGASSPSATTYRPIGGSGGTHKSDSSETKTRYWIIPIAIPFFIFAGYFGLRRFYREHKIERLRRRMLDEANEQETPSTAAMPPPTTTKTSNTPHSGVVHTPTATPYNLLSGPATLTVSTNANGTVTGTAAAPPPVTGVTSRWRNDLADLETRV